MLNIYFWHKFNYTGEMLYERLHRRLNGEVLKSVKEIDGTQFLLINLVNSKVTNQKVINSPKYIKNCNSEIAFKILDLNNIVYGNITVDTVKVCYDLLIMDMSTISIRKQVMNGDKIPPKYVKESECPRVVELAKKVLYLLGLDYAMITIAMNGKRKLKIANIDPSPVIREKDLLSLVFKLESIYLLTPEDSFKPVILGADPEFIMFNSKSRKMIPASEFFPKDGIIGCDNIRLPNRQQRPIAEIRPDPEISPIDLAVNIKKALLEAGRLVPYRNIKWIAGSQPMGNYSVGGHIHFSNVNISFNLLRALDNFVAIPLFLIENPESAVRRRKKYGTLADYRMKDYGGFEYRTLGSWLVSPEITLAVLCLAKIVATHYVELNSNYLSNFKAQQAFYEGNQDYFRSIFDDLWTKISNTETYLLYTRELSIIYDMIINYQTWDENTDIRDPWKIPKYAKHAKVNNSSRKIATSTTRRSSAIERSVSYFLPNTARNTRIIL